MKALLDTHALLWFALDDARLGGRARSVLMDRSNDLLVSPATRRCSLRRRLPQ